jgi:uncharacterized protein YlzI (FlbEa/FlbD family)
MDLETKLIGAVKMNKLVQSYIESITYLFPQGLAVLNSNFEMIYTYEDCDEESFKECIEKIEKNPDNNIQIILSNGNIIKSSKIEIQNEFYYFLSIEKIDSNPSNYLDPLLAKISFFLNDLPDGIAILKNDQVIFRNKKVAKLLGLSNDVKDTVHYSGFFQDSDLLDAFQNIITNEDKGGLVFPLKTKTGEEKWVKGIEELLFGLITLISLECSLTLKPFGLKKEGRLFIVILIFSKIDLGSPI